MSLKRAIYGFPWMHFYREMRSSQLSARWQDTEFGFRFSGNPTYLKDSWEPAEKAVIQKLLPKAAAFIDVGANQGFYTCLAAQQGVPVIAVEPEAGNLRFLKSNVRSNHFPVEIYPLAVSDEVGILELYGSSDTASLVPGWLGAPSYFRQDVPVNTLDNLIGQRWLNQKLLIKIDVEGAEAAVLRGARALITRQPRPFWLIESFSSGIDVMREAGYVVSQTSPNNHLCMPADDLTCVD